MPLIFVLSSSTQVHWQLKAAELSKSNTVTQSQTSLVLPELNNFDGVKRVLLNQFFLTPNAGHFFQLTSQANTRTITVILNFVVFSAQEGYISFYQRKDEEYN